MITTDTTATYDDFEPYVGGIPSPNPDYPQEIKSVVNPVVKVVGKNLLNPTLGTTTKYGVTCTANGDGTYTMNGTATTDMIFGVERKTYPKGKYKFLGCPSGGAYTSYLVYVSNITTGVEYLEDSGNGYVFELQQECELVLRLWCHNGFTLYLP